MKLVLIVLFFIPAYGLLKSESVQSWLFYQGSWEGKLEKIIDGDTLLISGRTIRLLYVDAPELRQKTRDGRPIGEMAKDFWQPHLGGPLKVRAAGKDRYGRELGAIEKDKRDLNLELIAQGFAVIHPSTLFPHPQIRRLYQAKLRRAKKWGYLSPSRFRKKNPFRPKFLVK